MLINRKKKKSKKQSKIDTESESDGDFVKPSKKVKQKEGKKQEAILSVKTHL